MKKTPKNLPAQVTPLTELYSYADDLAMIETFLNSNNDLKQTVNALPNKDLSLLSSAIRNIQESRRTEEFMQKLKRFENKRINLNVSSTDKKIRFNNLLEFGEISYIDNHAFISVNGYGSININNLITKDFYAIIPPVSTIAEKSEIHSIVSVMRLDCLFGYYNFLGYGTTPFYFESDKYVNKLFINPKQYKILEKNYTTVGVPKLPLKTPTI